MQTVLMTYHSLDRKPALICGLAGRTERALHRGQTWRCCKSESIEIHALDAFDRTALITLPAVKKRLAYCQMAWTIAQ